MALLKFRNCTENYDTVKIKYLSNNMEYQNKHLNFNINYPLKAAADCSKY